MNLPRSGRPTKITPRAQRRLIQEVIKEPRTASKELQASLASIKVSVHDSTIRKRLGKKRHSWESSKAKATADQKNTKACLTFAKKYLDYPQDFWTNILWTDETKLFGRCVSRYIWHKTNTAFHKKNIIPTVKHGGGRVMVWGCFIISGRQFVTSSALGSSSRTMIPNTPASPPLSHLSGSPRRCSVQSPFR